MRQTSSLCRKKIKQKVPRRSRGTRGSKESVGGKSIQERAKEEAQGGNKKDKRTERGSNREVFPDWQRDESNGLRIKRSELQTKRQNSDPAKKSEIG